MLKAIRVSTLILLLACSAQAGYMQNGSPEPPPPPPAPPVSAVQEPTNAPDETNANGYMQNGYIQNDAPSALTQIALEMLAVMPSLF